MNTSLNVHTVKTTACYEPRRSCSEPGGVRKTCIKIAKGFGAVLAAPLRISSSIINGAVFGTYFVTTLVGTGLAATGGTLYGLARIGIGKATDRPCKSLSEYAIKPAKKTFGASYKLFTKLPKHAPEYIFVGVPLAALFVGSAVAGQPVNFGSCPGSCDSSDNDKLPENSKRRKVGKALAKVLRPYDGVLNAGRYIMRQTQNTINPDG